MKNSIRLAAYQPEIPQNLGAMIRLCACLAVPIDIIEPCGFPFSKKALKRTAMDYLELAEIKQHDSFDAFSIYKSERRLILLTTSGTKNLWDFQFMSSDILMVGRESSGVPTSVVKCSSHRIRIPMPGRGRSLNVASCAAMAISEATRQLRENL